MSYEIFEAMVGRFRDLADRILTEVPFADYAAALLFVLAGLILGKLGYVVVTGILQIVHFDRLAERMGVYEAMGEDVRAVPSQVAGRIVYWLILALFFAAGIDSLQIVDVPHLMEGLAGLFGRVFSFAALLIISDLIGRLSGRVFDFMLRLVDHPWAGASRKVVHVTILAGAALTNVDVLGIDTRTPEGSGMLVLIAIIACIAAYLALKMHFAAMKVANALRMKVGIGDRITLADGRSGVVRAVLDDALVLAGDTDEWLVPAAWITDAPIKVEEL